MDKPHIFCSDSDLAHIGNGLCDRTLPKPAWTHAAHFAATVWVLACRPDMDAARDMPGLIRAYNEATGVPNTDTGGYHETITQASIRAARHMVERHHGTSLAHITNALVASPLGDKDWLLEYWEKPTLFSTTARRAWIDPDRAPMPY
jgi:hypothetical protein